jgi:hypothetical protein
MVPFSFLQPLLELRMMKIQLLLSSPLAGAKLAALLIFFIFPNWVQRHAGRVGQSCRNGRDGVSPSPTNVMLEIEGFQAI